MSFLSKLGKKLGNFAKKALPYAALAAPFIPGIGGAVTGALGKLGGALGLGSGSAKQANDTATPQVEVSAQRPSIDWTQTLGAIGTGYLNYQGMKQTNAANAQQAQRMMDFQNEQSSTSWQRGVADMKAAGLNPMLAYSQGGASAGGGAQATMGNELGAGANSAMSTAATIQQLKQVQASIDNIDADTANKENSNKLITAQYVESLRRGENLLPEGETKRLTEQLLRETLSDQIKEKHSAANLRDAQYQRELAEAGISGEGLSKARAYGEFYRSPFGKSYPYIEAGANTVNSAASAVSRFLPWK